MKNLFTISLLVLFTFSSFAQDAKSEDVKNFRFGVSALPALNWYKPADLKKFKNEGVVARLGVLLNAEYSFSGNFAFGFGIGITSAGGKISFLDSVGYKLDDDKMLAWNSNSTATSKTYLLKTRGYRASYFLLPVSLKMRTHEIGYMRYFFEPRFNLGIRKNVKADDEVDDWGSTSGNKQEDINISDDMSPLCLSVTLSGGGEYYISGSTALVFALGYHYGLSNTVQGKSENLLRTKNGAPTQLEQKFAQNGIALSVGILF